MTETVKNYIQLIEYQQQIDNFKKSHEELSNMDIIFKTIDFAQLENFLIKLGWNKKDSNLYYSMWEEPVSKEMISIIINKEIANWGENIEKILKVVAKIHNLDIKEVLENIFK